MRSLTIIASLLLLPGCNLFRSGQILQTCEDLPAGCDPVIDTQPTDDTGDTAPWFPEDPSTEGMVVVSKTDAEVLLRAFGVSGEPLASFSLAPNQAPGPGPVAYDPIQPRILMWDNSAGVLWVMADGAEPTSVAPDTSDSTELGWVYDTVLVDSMLYLVGATSVWSYEPGADSITRLGSASGVAQIQSVFQAFEENLFLLNWGHDDSPDLYRFTVTSSESRLSYEAYDDSLGRSASGFQGPSIKPYVCSSVGSVYAVETLSGGDRSPAAFPDQGQLEGFIGTGLLSSVTDCGWDDGAERYLVHSADHGIFAMDEWGRVEPRLQPESGEQFVRAAFFTIEETDAR